MRAILFGVDVAIAGGKRSAGGRIDKDGGDVDRFDGEECDGDDWRSGEEKSAGCKDEDPPPLGEADRFLDGETIPLIPLINGGD